MAEFISNRSDKTHQAQPKTNADVTFADFHAYLNEMSEDISQLKAAIGDLQGAVAQMQRQLADAETSAQRQAAEAESTRQATAVAQRKVIPDVQTEMAILESWMAKVSDSVQSVQAKEASLTEDAANVK